MVANLSHGGQLPVQDICISSRTLHQQNYKSLTQLIRRLNSVIMSLSRQPILSDH